MYVLRVALGFVGVCLRVETHCVSMIARVNYSLKLQHICELLINIRPPEAGDREYTYFFKYKDSVSCD